MHAHWAKLPKVSGDVLRINSERNEDDPCCLCFRQCYQLHGSPGASSCGKHCRASFTTLSTRSSGEASCQRQLCAWIQQCRCSPSFLTPLASVAALCNLRFISSTFPSGPILILAGGLAVGVSFMHAHPSAPSCFNPLHSAPACYPTIPETAMSFVFDIPIMFLYFEMRGLQYCALKHNEKM